jgi:toxin ParE1/3/4
MDVRWTIPALTDLDAIQDYIARDNPVAAYELTSAIFHRTETLLPVSPMMGRAGRTPDTREWILPEIPYIVVYRLTQHIEILAIMHTAKQWPQSFSHQD